MIDFENKLEMLISKLKDLSDSEKKCLQDLSFPFIPNFDEDFNSSKNRVLLVGQETSGWQGKLNKFLEPELDVKSIIQKSKNRHIELYTGSTGQSSFLQFMKQIKMNNNNEYVQWLNFYLFDYKKKSFNGFSAKNSYKTVYDELKKMSIKNLTEQILKLKPKVIFFVGQYHNNFPTLEEFLNLSSNEKVILKKPIDKLTINIWNNEILVFRTPHPAHFASVSQEARKAALSYLHLFNESEDIFEFKDKLFNLKEYNE